MSVPPIVCPPGYVWSEEFGRCITERQAELAVPAFNIADEIFGIGAKFKGPVGRLFSVAELLNLIFARIGGPEIFMSNQSVIAHAPGSSGENVYSYNSEGAPFGGALAGGVSYTAAQLDAIIAALYHDRNGFVYSALHKLASQMETLGGEHLVSQAGFVVPWPQFYYKGLEYNSVKPYLLASFGQAPYPSNDVNGFTFPAGNIFPLLILHLIPHLRFDVHQRGGVNGKVKADTLKELLSILTTASQWRG